MDKDEKNNKIENKTIFVVIGVIGIIIIFVVVDAGINTIFNSGQEVFVGEFSFNIPSDYTPYALMSGQEQINGVKSEKVTFMDLDKNTMFFIIVHDEDITNVLRYEGFVTTQINGKIGVYGYDSNGSFNMFAFQSNGKTIIYGTADDNYEEIFNQIIFNGNIH